MNQRQKLTLFTLLTLCFLFVWSPSACAQNKKTSFTFTILKSTGEPQKEVTAKINGRSEEYHPNEQGIIHFDFEINPTYSREITFSFPSKKEVRTFTLNEENATKTIYLDSPEDIVAFKQQNQMFPIEGIVQDEQQQPLCGATIHIQGTGRKAITDEIGLFQIEADYNHPIAIRADGMENRLIPITQFLQNPNEPLTVVMTTKGPEKIYSIAERMPEFPRGGMKAFSNYLKRNLKYPEQAKRDSIEGVVAIQFVVETTGETTSPVIVRHLEPSLDTVAIRLIRNMPRWIPASDNGKYVRCKYSVPVRFKIPRPKPLPAEKPQPKKDSLFTHLMPADSLLADSLAADSVLSMKKDSLVLEHTTDSLLHFSPTADSLYLKKDSLRWNTDSLMQIPGDTIQKDSVTIAETTVSATEQKPKKRNAFVRFFRWLFGIKDKSEKEQVVK